MMHNFNKLEKLLLNTPFGQSIKESEEVFYHNMTHKIFGYYAIQIGLPNIDFLHDNKITNKYQIPLEINCNLINLPFASESIDLIICPHTLELMINYEQLLKECYRILIPNGKLIITNFNKYSLLGISCLINKLYTNFINPPKKLTANQELNFAIQEINWINFNDLQKILIKSNFSLFGGKFFNYLPNINSTEQLKKLSILDKIGDRWLPSFSNIYAIIAKKDAVTATPIQEKKLQTVQANSIPELSNCKIITNKTN